MNDDKLPSPVDLAALMVSRVCHDVIGPVGAVANGLEILEEEEDQEMRDMAMSLVISSAEQASAKLQFARLAFGASGSAGAAIDLGDARKVVEGLLGPKSKVVLNWSTPDEAVPKDYVRLLLNLVQLAIEALPRGGDVSVKFTNPDQNAEVLVEASGQSIKTQEGLQERLNGVDDGELDARSVQPLLAALIASRLGLAIKMMRDEEKVSFSATAPAA